MKLISLNIWGGRITEPLLDFLKQQSNEIDIFCLQEVFNEAATSRSVHARSVMDIFSRIQKVLPQHKGYFLEEQINEEGMAIFVLNKVEVLESGEEFVFRWKNSMKSDDARTLGRAVQYIVIKKDDKEYFVGHLHGLWNGQGKTDTPDRIEQSKRTKVLLNKYNIPKIFVGDFNLLPDTESFMILKEEMRDLVSEYKIQSTRSSLYTKEIKLADYALVSNDLIVNDFKVLDVEISDHLPLILDFK